MPSQVATADDYATVAGCVRSCTMGKRTPLSATKKDSIVDTISAMEFCFIYGKCPIFALLPLISAVLRAFFLSQTTNPPPSAPQRQKWRIFVSFKGSIVQGINLQRSIVLCRKI
jgi:hypothetical protein